MVTSSGYFNVSKLIRKTRAKPQPSLPRFDRNTYIRAEKLRVIDDLGSNLGVLDRQAALQIAWDREEDLILINPLADPPVAKIMPWSKFKYELTKKRRNSKGKNAELKEMQFKPFIEIGDLLHKIDRIKEFLGKGHPVKITIKSRRNIAPDRVRETMVKIKDNLGDTVEYEDEPKFEGTNMSVYVKLKK